MQENASLNDYDSEGKIEMLPSDVRLPAEIKVAIMGYANVSLVTQVLTDAGVEWWLFDKAGEFIDGLW
jgi:hypothetical protein